MQRVIVCGDKTSSNSNRLREMASAANCEALLIGDPTELSRCFIEGHEAVGITAGASVPEEVVQETIARIGQWYEVNCARSATSSARAPSRHCRLQEPDEHSSG